MFKALLLAFSVAVASQSLGQKIPAIPSFGLGIEFGMPVGTFKNFADLGIGASLKFVAPLFTGGAFTASGGYMRFSGGFRGFNYIPLKAGLRYFVAKVLYFEPQLGMTFLSGKDVKSESAFTYAFNVGLALGNKIDLAPRYEAITKNGLTRAHVGVRLGFTL